MRQPFLSSLLLIPSAVVSFSVVQQQRPWSVASRLQSATSDVSLEGLGASLESALEACREDVAKKCKVTVGVSNSSSSSSSSGSDTNRLGLIATAPIKKGEVLLSIPYEEKLEWNAEISRNVVFQDILADSYEGWTGEAGLVALQLLNEVARASSTAGGVDLPKRTPPLQAFVETWVQALPSPQEMDHPLLWSEEDQEVLQSSTSSKIYRALDDLEEDTTWLIDNVFGKDRETFPETVQWNGQEIPCFSLKGYQWAMALSQSRSVFVDGSLRMLPLLDFANHDDEAEEIRGGTMGVFKTTKGAELVAAKAYKIGEEVFCSYGPKSAADYLLEHGFCPPQAWTTAVSEITLELSSEDQFYNDKLDILEFETYEQGSMDPTQSFDLVSAPGRDGEPDPAMIQFARLCRLGGTDAFLLESIFRKEIWEFMAMPVSERNEFGVVTTIIEALEKALEDLNQCPEGGREICTKLRESETKAVKRTLEFLQREKEALDLKEYYQERRLKDLGLDSDWAPEDDVVDPDMSFGQTRAPGGADYDW